VPHSKHPWRGPECPRLLVSVLSAFDWFYPLLPPVIDNSGDAAMCSS